MTELKNSVDDVSDMSVHIMIFAGCITVFLITHVIWTLYQRKLDRKYGNEVNKRYWSNLNDSPAQEIIDDGITVKIDDEQV